MIFFCRAIAEITTNIIEGFLWAKGERVFWIRGSLHKTTATFPESCVCAFWISQTIITTVLKRCRMRDIIEIVTPKITFICIQVLASRSPSTVPNERSWMADKRNKTIKVLVFKFIHLKLICKTWILACLMDILH